MELTQERLVGAVPVVGRDRRGFWWPWCQEGTETEGDAGEVGRQGQPWGQAQPAAHTRVLTHRCGTAASATGQKAQRVLLP